MLLLQSLDLLCDVYQLRKRNVQGCTGDHYGYRIVCDAGLVSLDHDLIRISKACEKQLTLLKNLTDLVIFTDYIYTCLTAGCHVHLGTDVTDTANGFLNRFDGFLLCGECTILAVLRPLTDHDGLFFVLNGAEDFLGDERHVRM